MSWRLKLRALRNPHLRRDLEDELASHIDMRAEALRAEGWAPDAALREARRRFGSVNQIEEVTRELHVFTFLETLLQDVRYGLRRLRHEPGFTLVAVLTLGLVIGANGAIFSLMEAVLLRPLPFSKPEQLVYLRAKYLQTDNVGIAPPDIQDYARARSLSSVAGMMSQSVNLTGVDEPTRLFGAFVTSSFFSALNVRAAEGRVFGQEADSPGAPRVCVISHGIWQRRCGGDPTIVGRALILNGEPHTVVGIMPAGFWTAFLIADVWLPVQFHPNYQPERSWAGLRAFGRLRDGASLEQARAELTTLAGQLEAEYPDSHRGRSLWIVPLHEQTVQPQRRTVLVLVGGVICVLLIGCANIAGLLMTKAIGRTHEMSLRASLGAGRVRLVRQLLTESLLLALTGGVLGLALAYAGMALINAFWIDLLNGTVLTLNGVVVAYLLAISTGTGLLFGLAPAFLARRQAAPSLRQRGTLAADSPLRSVLVASQVALALVLLIGAGLMMKSVARLAGVDPGFRGERVLTMEYRVPRNKYPQPEQQTRFHYDVAARVAALPGVESAALVGALPFSGNFGSADVTFPGRPEPPRESPYTVWLNLTTPGYFQTIGVPVVDGRDFTLADAAASVPVAIVSRSFVARYFPGERAVGQQVSLPPRERGETRRTLATIVGVVGDVRNALSRDELPQLYVPYAQQPFIFATLTLRAKGDPRAMARDAQRAIWSVDKDQPMWKIRTLQSLVDGSFSYSRYVVFMLGSFSALALLLAALGLYGVLAYSVTQRTAEFGVRLAIGATPAHIVRLVVGKGLVLALAGLACGVGAALLLMRYLRTQLFEVTTYDPAIYVGVSAVLIAVALVAVFLPARRATKVDPVIALRQ